MSKVQRYNRNQLSKVGIEVLNLQRIILCCENCKQVWSPNILSGGRLPRDYWKCPNGCN